MAVTPPLMSERDEPHAPGWRDCMYAAGLMAVYKQGYRDFPLGFDAEEREALERSDERPDEQGASVADLDTATMRRYGLKLGRVPRGDLGAALRGPATTGLVVAGVNRVLPKWLRRWTPRFAGAHSVYVQPMGDGLHVRWMDPMATWGYPGDVVDHGIVLAWNAATNGKANSCRFAREPATVVAVPTPGVTLKYGGYAGFRGRWRVMQNYSRFRRSPFIKRDNIIEMVDAGHEFRNSQTTDQGTFVNGSRRWLGDASGDRWMHVSLVELVR